MLPENLILILAVAFYGVIGAYIVLMWYRNRDKYLIRIRYPTEKKMLVAPQGNEVILQKGKGRRLAWRVSFDMACLYFSKSNWGLSKRLTMDVMPDAKKAIPYFKPLDPDKIPKWTRSEHEEHAQLDGLRALQRFMQHKTDTILWIIVILLIADIIMPFILSRYGF